MSTASPSSGDFITSPAGDRTQSNVQSGTAESLAPDSLARGFVATLPDPLRYGQTVNDPAESTGLILRFLPEGGRVLDVGCGTGTVTCFMRDDRRCDVIGLEPDAARAQAARNRGLHVLQTILEPGLRDQLGLFDAVTFADVLEHLPDPAGALRTAQLFLKPGGCVVASVPNVAHWTVRLNLLCGRFDYRPWGIMDATHLRWFTAKTFRYLFESQGYVVRDALAASAGTWVQAYYASLPWRRLAQPRRDRLVRKLASSWPELFGAQWIIRACAV